MSVISNALIQYKGEDNFMKNNEKKKVLNMVEIIIGALFLIGFITCIIFAVRR